MVVSAFRELQDQAVAKTVVAGHFPVNCGENTIVLQSSEFVFVRQCSDVGFLGQI